MRAMTTTFRALAWLVFLLPLTGLAQSDEVKGDILISVVGSPSLGVKGARVTIVEFGDYQCPLYGQHFNWIMRQLVDEYVKTGQVRYVFRDFPIESTHPLPHDPVKVLA